MLDNIICATTNLFRIYLIYQFAKAFFGEPKASKTKSALVCALFYISNLALFWSFHTAWINLSCNLIGTFAVTCLFARSFKSRLFATVSITILNIACDALAVSLFVSYSDGVQFDQIYEVLTDFLILICLLLCSLIIKTHKHTEQGFRISLISVPICSIIIIMFMIYNNIYTEAGLATIGLGLLVINFFMFYQYNQLLLSIQKKYENEMLEQKVQLYSNELNTIMESEERVKALRHDMKHHINELMILANRNKADEIVQYLNRMNGSLQNPSEIVSSGNLEIDSVLNLLLSRAKEKLETVNVKVQLPEDVKHSFDINIVLGNLLENAIEAAEQTTKKYLNVDISLKKGVLLIQIDNSYLPDKPKEAINTDIKSLNSHPKKHLGLGLKNVQRIVKLYNGNIDITQSDDLFSVKVLLYNTLIKQ